MSEAAIARMYPNEDLTPQRSLEPNISETISLPNVRFLTENGGVYIEFNLFHRVENVLWGSKPYSDIAETRKYYSRILEYLTTIYGQPTDSTLTLENESMQWDKGDYRMGLALSRRDRVVLFSKDLNHNADDVPAIDESQDFKSDQTPKPKSKREADYREKLLQAHF